MIVLRACLVYVRDPPTGRRMTPTSGSCIEACAVVEKRRRGVVDVQRKSSLGKGRGQYVKAWVRLGILTSTTRSFQ